MKLDFKCNQFIDNIYLEYHIIGLIICNFILNIFYEKKTKNLFEKDHVFNVYSFYI